MQDGKYDRDPGTSTFCSAFLGERLDRFASDVFNGLRTTEEVLQDQLRAKFEEAIDHVLCAVSEQQGVPGVT